LTLAPKEDIFSVVDLRSDILAFEVNEKRDTHFRIRATPCLWAVTPKVHL
jgi:hypothetical protein